MSMANRFALAVSLVLVTSAAIAADMPGLGKPVSEADLALWATDRIPGNPDAI